MRFFFLVLVLLWTLLPAGAENNRGEIKASLQHGVECWNRGDLDGFMQDYVKSPEMTFTAGGRLVRGYDALQKRYQDTYGNSRDTMGQLRFDNIEIQDLGPDHALAVGHWVLDVTNKNLKKETLQGIFSLVLRKTPQGWKILHDHTSREETKSP